MCCFYCDTLSYHDGLCANAVPLIITPHPVVSVSVMSMDFRGILDINCKQNKLAIRGMADHPTLLDFLDQLEDPEEQRKHSFTLPAGKQWRLHVNACGGELSSKRVIIQ